MPSFTNAVFSASDANTIAVLGAGCHFIAGYSTMKIVINGITDASSIYIMISSDETNAVSDYYTETITNTYYLPVPQGLSQSVDIVLTNSAGEKYSVHYSNFVMYRYSDPVVYNIKSTRPSATSNSAVVTFKSTVFQFSASAKKYQIYYKTKPVGTDTWSNATYVVNNDSNLQNGSHSVTINNLDYDKEYDIQVTVSDLFNSIPYDGTIGTAKTIVSIRKHSVGIGGINNTDDTFVSWYSMYHGGYELWDKGNLPQYSGTWEPVFKYQNTANGSPGITLGDHSCQYYRFGNEVYVKGYIEATPKYVYYPIMIGGLPFAAVTTSGLDCIYCINALASGNMASYKVDGNCILICDPMGGNETGSSNNNGMILQFSGKYMI